MAWYGYFDLDGNEVVNVARTEQYVIADGGSYWFTARYKIPELADLLGETDYTNALQDDAPWTDPDLPESYEFYGTYPLAVTGLEDSTRTSTVTEFIGDGGNPGRIRDATSQVVFSLALLASTEAGAAYGLQWLKRALSGGPCGSPDGCDGGVLTFCESRPNFDPTMDPIACMSDYLRTLHRVTVNAGPTLTARNQLSDETTEFWTVSFTAVAGVPWEFGPDVPIVAGMFSVDDPVIVPGGSANSTDPETVDEAPCVPSAYQPVSDPNCPALVSPPLPPDVPLGCFTPPDSWLRYSISIPDDVVHIWESVVPTFVITAPDDQDVRNLRFRIYPDSVDPDSDPCGFTADVLVSYIPQGGTLTIDSILQQVNFSGGNGVVRADSLVFASDGSPFVWPLIACGEGQFVAIDVTADQTELPSIDLTLTGRGN